MAIKHDQPSSGTERPESERINAVIGKHVMLRLGQPHDLFGIQVRPLWDAFYRVNILVGPSVVSAKVAQSFFLQADGDGNILVTRPEITRLY
jgi:hypothetical protein